MFKQFGELDPQDQVQNLKADIYFYIKNAFFIDIDVSKYWVSKDVQKEGSIERTDFMNSLR